MINEEIKKKILLITPFCRPSIGGAETYLDEIVAYLQKNNYYVYIVTYQPITSALEGAPLEKLENLEIHRYRWIGFNLFHKLEKFPAVFNFVYLTPYLFILSFLFLLRHRKIEVIDAQGLNSAFISAILKRIFRKRSVATILALYSFKKKSFFSYVVKWILSAQDIVIAESITSRDEIIEIGVPSEKVVVFDEWIDLERFKPRDKEVIKEELGWDGKFIVLFVGRAIPIKGADTLLDVAKNTKIENINFAFITDAGPQVNLIREAGERMNNVTFVGGVDYKELHKYYNAADIFVIPSRYEENAARTMVEAVCSGTPVVASNRGAIPTVLDSTVAVLVEPTAEEIQRAVEDLFSKPAKLKRLANNCREFSLCHFSDKNAKVIISAYEGVH